MGAVYADLTLVNLFNKKSTVIRALVDTGATEMFVTADIAANLGFDIEEVIRKTVILADGRRFAAPRIGPLEIRFEDRSVYFEAFVLGDECLMGQIPLEALDLIVDPKGQRLIGAHAAGYLRRA
jgi:clan AA aspartic protease